jgi:XTP/dITP diphosphohydrolase
MELVLASGNAGKLVEFATCSADSGLDCARSRVRRRRLRGNRRDLRRERVAQGPPRGAMTVARRSATIPGCAWMALGGAPGLCSARYAGVHGDAIATSRGCCDECADVPDARRSARFYCVLVLLRFQDDPQPLIAEGEWRGRILRSPRRRRGFGYDPVFFDPENACSAAELDPVVKNLRSATVGGAGGAETAPADVVVAAMLSTPPLSLYVHLPWCVRKCRTAISIRTRREGALPFAAYVDALVADLEHRPAAGLGPHGAEVFFGGGRRRCFRPSRSTHSCRRPVRACVSRPRWRSPWKPTGYRRARRFEHYRAAGVNRISFGVQTFDDPCLQRLGRSTTVRRPMPRSNSRRTQASTTSTST